MKQDVFNKQLRNKEKQTMTSEPTIAEAIETFKKKYDFPDISSVDADVEGDTINVFTTNAKIWVDLPEYHQGYFVKMNVTRRPRSR